jgi:hypothetical protein
MADLKINPLGGAEPTNQPTNKSVRMHVMPDNVINQEELYQKVSKAGQVKEIKETPGNPLTPPSPAPTPATPPAVFTRPSAPATSGGKGKKMAIILIVLLILGGSVFGAWYWWSGRQSDDGNLAELERIAEEQRLAEELRLAEEQRLAAEAEKLAEEKRQKEERDRQRISDVIDRQEGLRLYFEKNQMYPESIPESGAWQEGEMVLASELKIDPVNDNDYKYIYARVSEKSYTLSARFEIGFNKISAGLNVFTEQQKVKADGTIEKIEALPEPELPTLTFSLDTDEDGLTDLEEALYKSDINLVDSDGDSYEDSLEIKNLYSPSNTAPQTLVEAALVQEFLSELNGYKMLYPVSWKVQKIDVDDSNVMFISANTSEYVELKIEENAGELALSSWVKLRMQNLPLKFKATYSEEVFENKDKSLQGILLPELYMAFFADGNKVYTLTYQFDPTKQLSYQTTFLMFAKSFRLLAKELVLPEEAADGSPAAAEEAEAAAVEAAAETTPDEDAFNDALNQFFSEADDSEEETGESADTEITPEASGELDTGEEVDTGTL